MILHKQNIDTTINVYIPVFLILRHRKNLLFKLFKLIDRNQNRGTWKIIQKNWILIHF